MSQISDSFPTTFSPRSLRSGARHFLSPLLTRSLVPKALIASLRRTTLGSPTEVLRSARLFRRWSTIRTAGRSCCSELSLSLTRYAPPAPTLVLSPGLCVFFSLPLLSTSLSLCVFLSGLLILLALFVRRWSLASLSFRISHIE